MSHYHHDFHPSILRAYDIRGIVGKTLSDKDAFAIGVGFAHIITEKQACDAPKIAVGYDGRISSPDLAEALIEGLMAGGADVQAIGLGPTPMLYFADREYACDGAIQITGSHNPKDYNGFKLVCAHQSFYGDDITALGAVMAQGINVEKKGCRTDREVFDAYNARLAADSMTGEDRLGVIDAKGRHVPGDILTAFIAGEYLQRAPGETILFDVKSSAAAMRLVSQAGGVPLLWKTGHSHMKSRMAEIDCQLAGEMSGHIFIKDGYYGFDDALYVAIRLLRTMIRTNQTITDFMDNLPPSFTTPECRVACDDDIKFEIMDALATAAEAEFSDKDVLLIDGIRVQDETGWWLCRASNTEACLVVRAEGVDDDALARKVAELKALLASQSINWDYS